LQKQEPEGIEAIPGGGLVSPPGPRNRSPTGERAMKEWLSIATAYSIVVINMLALIVIVVGTVETFFGGLRAMLSSPDGHTRRDIWLRYARWLVAGLTFQLAADILETAVTESWDAVGRIAAVAAIRTFLNYFLDRDLTEIRDRQNEKGQPI
jgi:uncharacterized membrane protein